MPDTTKKSVVCPECGKDVELTVDEDGEATGRCPACKLDVGAVYTRRRYQKALRRVEEAEEAENPRPKRRSLNPFEN